MKSPARPLAVALGLTVLVATVPAAAGGFDIPTLYTARHTGMGGVAISSVDDASAVYHNPAGLGSVSRTNVLANLSVFVTNQQTSPDYPDQNIKTGYRVGPAPFLAGAMRVHDIVAIGFGAYPIGAVSGHFEYANSFGNPTLNEQTALAFEATPAVAVAPLRGLRFGLGYRITFLTFQRRLGPQADPSTVDIDTFGADFAGFRLGAQWQPVREFSAGVAYRHPVHVTSSASRGRLLGQPVTDIEGSLVIPAKFGVGVRLMPDPISVAIDYELVRNSQFDQLAVKGNLPSQGSELNVPFVFNWNDSSTIKAGVEYRIDRVRLRGGYAYDGTFVNRAYPSTFSSPPTDAHYFTLGSGYDAGPWQVNVALVERTTASEYIYEEQIASKAECPFCGSSGWYASSLAAAFIDFSVNLGAGAENPYDKEIRR